MDKNLLFSNLYMVGIPSFCYITYKKVLNRGQDIDISFAEGLKAPNKELLVGAHESDYRVKNRTLW